MDTQGRTRQNSATPHVKQTKENMKELEKTITALVGEASTLFGPGVGVFDTTRAKDIVSRIMAQFPTPKEPWLGQASTGQLLDELRARAEADGTLDYRTVDEL